MSTHTIIFSVKRQELRITNGFGRFASDTYNYISARFELDEEWEEYDVIKAIWQNDACKVTQLISDNTEVPVPAEVLSRKAPITVNLVGYKTENDELVKRLTTYPCPAFIIDRKVMVDGNEASGITQNLFEQYIEIVAAEVSKVTDMTVSAHADTEPSVEKTESGGAVHLSFGLVKGDKGDQGDPGTDGVDGSDGADGEDGVGIDSITKTDTSGLVDTYTITFTDGSTTTFNVTNGEDADAAKGVPVYFGVCETAASEREKIVAVSGDFVLEDGALLYVHFKHAVEVQSPSLNVNSTGDYFISMNKSSGGVYLFNAEWQPISGNSVIGFVINQLSENRWCYTLLDYGAPPWYLDKYGRDSLNLPKPLLYWGEIGAGDTFCNIIISPAGGARDIFSVTASRDDETNGIAYNVPCTWQYDYSNAYSTTEATLTVSIDSASTDEIYIQVLVYPDL